MSKFILSAFADEIDENLDVQMDVLESHGIKYIEMRGVNGKNVTQYSLQEIQDIKKQLDKRGFKISAIGSPIGKIKITDDFEPHLELFKHTLEIANILEARYIRMFSFYMPEDEDPSKYRDEVMKRWQQFINEAQKTSIVLLHENEKGIYGDTVEHCLDLLNAMSSPYVRITFDPANFVQIDAKSYPDAFMALKDYFEYMHIKDASYATHSVVPAGHGDGKIKEILTELMEMGYEGFISLEPHLANFKGYSALEQEGGRQELPEGGPEVFGFAVSQLKKILDDIGANY